MTEQELLDIVKRELEGRRPLLYSMTEIAMTVDCQVILKTVDGFNGACEVKDALRTDRHSQMIQSTVYRETAQQVRMWLEEFEHTYATWRVNRAKRELIESLPKPRPESMGDAPLQGFRLRRRDPLQSFDGVLWAREFMRLKSDGTFGEIDEDLMRAWFCNALMRGFDEATQHQRAQRDCKNAKPQKDS